MQASSCRAELTPAFVGGERVDDLVEIAGQHPIEGVQREPDAMIGDAVLLEVVRADLLGATAALHLLAAGGADLFVLLVLLGLQEPRRRMRIALSLFWSWLFSSCIATTRPVGLCVMRTAESVVLTD